MCGIAGVVIPQNFFERPAEGTYVSSIASLVYVMLWAQQHRGKEGAGIAVESDILRIHKRKGTLDVVFQNKPDARSIISFLQEGFQTGYDDLVVRLEKEFNRGSLAYEPLTWLEGNSVNGESAIGHVRYSTAGGDAHCNVQPLRGTTNSGVPFAIVHNGNLTNWKKIRTDLEQKGALFETSSDTEVIVKLIEGSLKNDFRDALIETTSVIEGAYSILALYGHKLYALRDPHGWRPLVHGKRKSQDGHTLHMFASETCAFDVLRGTRLELTTAEEVLPGMCIEVSPEKEYSISFTSACVNPCGFELVYFQRPDSRIYWNTNTPVSAAEFRRALGRELAREAKLHDIDGVIPVPDSSNYIAEGFSQEAGIPLLNALFRSHYVGRTFMEPLQERRALLQRIKHNVIEGMVWGKNIAVVDDSIVRGTTSKKVISFLREAGASKVHFLSAYPPVKAPCFWGMDFPTYGELIASFSDIETIRKEIGADTLTYMSVEGYKKTLRSIGIRGEVCAGCILGHTQKGEEIYPLTISISV